MPEWQKTATECRVTRYRPRFGTRESFRSESDRTSPKRAARLPMPPPVAASGHVSVRVPFGPVKWAESGSWCVNRGLNGQTGARTHHRVPGRSSYACQLDEGVVAHLDALLGHGGICHRPLHGTWLGRTVGGRSIGGPKAVTPRLGMRGRRWVPGGAVSSCGARSSSLHRMTRREKLQAIPPAALLDDVSRRRRGRGRGRRVSGQCATPSARARSTASDTVSPGRHRYADAPYSRSAPKKRPGPSAVSFAIGVRRLTAGMARQRPSLPELVRPDQPLLPVVRTAGELRCRQA